MEILKRLGFKRRNGQAREPDFGLEDVLSGGNVFFVDKVGKNQINIMDYDGKTDDTLIKISMQISDEPVGKEDDDVDRPDPKFTEVETDSSVKQWTVNRRIKTDDLETYVNADNSELKEMIPPDKWYQGVGRYGLEYL